MLLLALLVGCPRLAPPRYAPWEDGYVLVWSDAWLATGTGEAPRFRRDASSERAPGSVFVVRLRADLDDRVLVETFAPVAGGGHCFGGIEELEGYALRVLVDRADLAPVVARQVGVDTRGGAQVVLPPGAAVGPSAEDGFRAVVAADGAVDAHLPRNALGWWYSPRWEVPCALNGAPARPTGPVLGYLSGSADLLAPAGSPVFWPDGREAGFLLADQTFYDEDVRDFASGGMLCVPLVLGSDDAPGVAPRAERVMDVCHRLGDLVPN